MPQQCLNLLPLPQEHSAFRLIGVRRLIGLPAGGDCVMDLLQAAIMPDEAVHRRVDARAPARVR